MNVLPSPRNLADLALQGTSASSDQLQRLVERLELMSLPARSTNNARVD